MPYDKLSFMKNDKGNVSVIGEFVNDKPFEIELKYTEIWLILKKITNFIFSIHSELYSTGDNPSIVVYENTPKNFVMKYDKSLFHITIGYNHITYTFSYNQGHISNLIKFLL